MRPVATKASALLQAHPRLAALCLGWLGVALIFGAAELTWRTLLAKPRPVVSLPDGYATTDRWGRQSPAGAGDYVAKAVDPRSGETLYEVVYSIEAALRRITPASGGSRSDFAAFFGGSFTYGEGVQGDETTPYHFGRFAPEHRPYNYGFSGHGPSDMLAKLESGTLRGEIVEPDGLLVYVFNDHHVDRTIGTLRFVGSWGRDKPCYELSDEGKVVWRGTFSTAHPWRTRLHRLLAASVFLDRIGFDWPLVVGDEDIDFVARVILRSRELFAEQFPGSSFRVVTYPGSHDYGPALLERLREHGLPGIDLLELFDPKLPEYRLGIDPHPSPRAHELFARALAAELGLGARGRLLGHAPGPKLGAP